ncbi:MAG: lipid-binding SYLF domain-containing protein [Candidatus Azotimanducaceae bacterium]
MGLRRIDPTELIEVKMRQIALLTLFMTTMSLISGPSYADGAEKKRQKILDMRTEVLARLYREKPSTKSEVKKAEGYAVFSNIGINLVLFSAGGGQGVVHDNQSGDNTYMNMGSAGVGFGLGIKDFRGVFVFHNRDAMKTFISSGWDFSGQADAAAKSGDKGDETSLSASVINGVSLYQLTENGLALQATLQGTKYWKSKKLN